MKNTWLNRMYLIAHRMANDLLGYQSQNFLALILEEENGRYGNEQMTIYFKRIFNVLCDMTASESFDMIDDLLESNLVKLSGIELDMYYNKYVRDRIDIVADQESI